MRLGLLCSLLVVLTACHKMEANPDTKTGVAASAPEAASPLEIASTPDLEKKIRVGEAVMMPIANTYSVSARVEADETRQARVGTPVTGRITELMVREGDAVKKGQVLATLNSTELTNAQFSLLRAQSQATLMQHAVERAQQLLDAGVIGVAELQRRQAEQTQAMAEASALRDQLKVLGMPDDAAKNLEATRAVNSLSQIVASIDGMVLERKATVGQVVQPADTIFLLADLSGVWLAADVPEQTAGNLSEGEAVEAEVLSLPGQKLRGRLTHVHSVLNPETRTVKVHMDVANPRGRLKPAMLATMTLREAAAAKRMVPITAVVRENNKEFVFVRNNPKTYALREVTLGTEFQDMRVVENGLKPKETIVLDGAFHLNNERIRLSLEGSSK